MFKKGNFAKLEQIVNYIEDVFLIVENHKGLESALSDKEGEYAIMMCIIQIGETVNKITDPTIIEKIPSAKIIGLKNRIVHGYETFDRRIITDVIKLHLPELKMIITELLKDYT